MPAIFGAPASAHLVETQPSPARRGAVANNGPKLFNPQAEGWDVFDCAPHDDGTPRAELQRLDSPARGTPAFRDDKDAWEHVVSQARAGSRPHQRALQALDPFERFAIEARCGWCPGL